MAVGRGGVRKTEVMEDILLSVVIVNYNVKYLLEQCLLSVRRAVQGIPAEIFVVDNASTDGSVAYLQERFAEVRFIANGTNPGFSRANNQAIRLSRGRYVLLLNPDTVVGEEVFHRLLDFAGRHPDAGGIGVKMLNGQGQFLPESKRCFPSTWVSFCKIFGLSRLFPRSRFFARYTLPFLDAGTVHGVEVLSGAFMLLRREALDRCGLLDEAFFMYGEDIDLSYRLVLGGYRNYYVPERILHYKGESTRHSDLKYIRAFYGAMLIFYRKYYGRSGWLASWFIKGAIRFKEGMAVISRRRKKHPERERLRRVLWVGDASRLPMLREVLPDRLPGVSEMLHGNVELLCEGKPLSLPAGITDVVFCFPDLSFSRMLEGMDVPGRRGVTYHIWHAATGRMISPGMG